MVINMENTGRNVRLRQHCRKRRKRRKKHVLTEAVFLMAEISVVCFVAILIILFFADDPETSTKLRTAAENGYSESVVPDSENHVCPEINVDLEHLYSPYAILVELDSGKVLAEHNDEDKIYPASLTKIMTTLLAIENTDDMNQTVTLPYEIFEPLYAENASMAGFQPGEEVTLKDLLYGILLPSGAECCVTFADRIAGSEEAFVDMMNEKATEMGMSGTHFCNVTGLHDPDHYSTVKDISVLLRYALQYEVFRQAFSSSCYTTQPTNLHPDGITFHSTMFKYMDNAEVIGGKIIGGKTGYTEEAGLCLASLAEVGGREYILVTAKAKGTHQTEQFHILDAINVYSQIGELNVTSERRSENERSRSFPSASWTNFPTRCRATGNIL